VSTFALPFPAAAPAAAELMPDGTSMVLSPLPLPLLAGFPAFAFGLPLAAGVAGAAELFAAGGSAPPVAGGAAPFAFGLGVFLAAIAAAAAELFTAGGSAAALPT
jgi:hypothetical protein